MIKPGPPGLGCCYPSPHPVTVSIHTVHVGTKVPRTHLSREYSNTGRLPLLEPLNIEGGAGRVQAHNQMPQVGPPYQPRVALKRWF